MNMRSAFNNYAQPNIPQVANNMRNIGHELYS